MAAEKTNLVLAGAQHMLLSWQREVQLGRSFPFGFIEQKEQRP
jgi:hypothetical protein